MIFLYHYGSSQSPASHIARKIPCAEAAASESGLARSLLRFGLLLSGIGPEAVTIAGGHGTRPYIPGRPDLHISLSHCEGLVACSLGRDDISVDAENIRPFEGQVAKRVCSPSELETITRSSDPNAAFFRCWTLKESYGKALGVGLGYPLRETAFLIGGGRVSSNIKDCEFALYEGIKGYVVAICRRNVKTEELFDERIC